MSQTLHTTPWRWDRSFAGPRKIRPFRLHNVFQLVTIPLPALVLQPATFDSRLLHVPPALLIVQQLDVLPYCLEFRLGPCCMLTGSRNSTSMLQSNMSEIVIRSSRAVQMTQTHVPLQHEQYPIDFRGPSNKCDIRE